MGMNIREAGRPVKEDQEQKSYYRTGILHYPQGKDIWLKSSLARKGGFLLITRRDCRKTLQYS
jgi:hypothetical protein